MIHAKTIWKEKMLFSGEAGANSAPLDAKSPLGNGAGMTPKEMVAVGVCGCTAMDVVALLKKYKQPLESFEVSADVNTTEGVHPAVFQDLMLTFTLKGALDPTKVLEAVHLSQTKYCGVSAMIVKAAPIQYKVILNNQEIGKGDAKF